MQVYLLKYKSINQKSYLAMNKTPKQLYLVSAIDVRDDTLTYLYRYNELFIPRYSGAYFLLLTYHLYYYSEPNTLNLDVFTLNITGISLYIWLNYQLLIQRKIYADTSSKYNLVLTYINLRSRNFLKRYLIFR